MKLNKLFEMQRELDNHIIQEHELEGKNLISNKTVAFIVELSELANELRFFKHWSNKGPSSKEIILEEYVDGLHFLLSLGLEIETDIMLEENFDVIYVTRATLTEEFLVIYRLATDFEISLNLKTLSNSLETYKKLLNRYLSLGKVLGFSQEEIFQGYISKNKINHQRQESGY